MLGAIVAGLSFLGGCGTIINLAFGTEQPGAHLLLKTEIYGGVQVDAGAVHKGSQWEEDWLTNILGIMFIFDFPLSFIADTITLPITIPIVLFREDKKPGSAPPLFP